MKQRLTIVFYFVLIGVNAQIIDKTFVDTWIRSCDPEIQVDSVLAYYIDGDLYEGYNISALNARLGEVTADKIHFIFYSKTKSCNYVPGKGSIYILSVKKRDYKANKSWLTESKQLFNDKYGSSSQHILTNSKDPVLVIDGEVVHYAHAKDVLRKIDPKDIYDISVNNFFPVPGNIYGQNSKNGLVQIWTIEKFKE